MVSKLLSTLVLVAGLLWSSVCVAQCRIVPASALQAAANQDQEKLPPCHQKQHKQQQKQCSDPCDARYAEVSTGQTSDDLMIAHALDFSSVSAAAFLLDAAPPPITSGLTEPGTRPPGPHSVDSTTILRI